MKKNFLAALAVLSSLQPAPGLAQNYEVNLNRMGSNRRPPRFQWRGRLESRGHYALTSAAW